MSYKTDIQRVQGLGSAKEGTQHWVSQRLTALALIPLTLAFLVPFAQVLGSDFSDVALQYKNPLHALVAIGFFYVTFRHLRLGLQVVIEDYISNHRMRTGLLIINTLSMRAFAFIGIFSVAKIAFSA